MTGVDDWTIDQENTRYSQKVLLGCGLLALLALMGLAAMTILAVKRDYESARYPDAVVVSSHSNYKGLPTAFKWDQAYRSTDNFTSVYNWYSIRFNLGAESRAAERCIYLEGVNRQFFVARYTSVFLCNTPSGQMIYVSRSTSIR